jgi:regulator of replication initiation timing
MVENIKTIVDVLNAALSAEGKKELAKLANAYYAAIDENFRLREENDKLRRQLNDKDQQMRKLNDKLEAKQKLIFEPQEDKRGFYLQVSPTEKIGPVCQLCYNENGTVSILQNTSNGAFCPVCKNTFAGIVAKIEGKYGQTW